STAESTPRRAGLDVRGTDRGLLREAPLTVQDAGGARHAFGRDPRSRRRDASKERTFVEEALGCRREALVGRLLRAQRRRRRGGRRRAVPGARPRGLRGKARRAQWAREGETRRRTLDDRLLRVRG